LCNHGLPIIVSCYLLRNYLTIITLNVIENIFTCGDYYYTGVGKSRFTVVSTRNAEFILVLLLLLLLYYLYYLPYYFVSLPMIYLLGNDG